MEFSTFKSISRPLSREHFLDSRYSGNTAACSRWLQVTGATIGVMEGPPGQRGDQHPSEGVKEHREINSKAGPGPVYKLSKDEERHVI